jgi:prepilin-type N-terminal cleavage/methylation domain-containing protein
MASRPAFRPKRSRLAPRAWRRSPARPRSLAAEDGFTLFELLAAITLLAVGLIALVGTFDGSRDLVSVAEKTEVATHRAERELERILALPYASVAHPSTPGSSTDQTSPASFVSSTNYQYDQGSTGPRSETLAVVPGSTVDTAPATWTDSESRLRGRIQSFVTWTGDAVCTPTNGSLCAKRVTVAVTVDGNRPLRRPVLISTIVSNPAGS